MTKATQTFKCGTVALIGEPNTGKSSLVNALVGEPVSIVSDRAGTTRERIRGVLNGDGFQIVFLDTPGMLKQNDGLGKFMRKSISHAVAEADVLIYVLDAADIRGAHKIAHYQGKQPLIIAVNKTDLTNFEKLYPALGELNKLTFVKAIVPISVKTRANLSTLVAEIVKTLPGGKPMFADDDFTDQSVKKMCEEIFRGELLNALRAEVPHGVAVRAAQFTETARQVDINIEILCAKPTHKPIIIGKNGAVLKAAGIAARRQIEKLLGKHANIKSHVLVRENWRDSKTLLDELGYTH